MIKRPQIEPADAQHFMDLALAEARKAEAIGEVPIGAVIIKDGEVIATGYNHRETDQLATAHAEILAIEEANRSIGSFRLEDTALFVTLEPCVMCAGAIVNSRIPVLYYGAEDPKAGGTRSLYQILEDDRLNHQVEVHAGLEAEQSGQLLQSFFQKIRAARKAKKLSIKPED
ncbi:tRNA adenosine(34) deaminase TadA [Eupransor demetentiae]|uniref:tRNA-specific adenosine deaminase n=1 Tax=Eupransor demetentiae TaxID=3109584 RepID=A0ABM9N5B4_9LACO|nr:tRNA(Arg) A34 adenosine deaminase TadA (TadA) [Lactobacillaceae bacterium LMG 33000]